MEVASQVEVFLSALFQVASFTLQSKLINPQGLPASGKKYVDPPPGWQMVDNVKFHCFQPGEGQTVPLSAHEGEEASTKKEEEEEESANIALSADKALSAMLENKKPRFR